MLALAIANVMATRPCVIRLLNKVGRKRRSLMLRAAQEFDKHTGTKFVGVAFIVATMLGVSRAGEWPDYTPRCPDEFVKAWDGWDQSDPAKMPPLQQEPC